MYQLLKLVHLLGVVVFLGNIITGLFWKRHADRTGDSRLIAHTLRGLIRSDAWFTNPGVLVVAFSGVAAALQGGLPIVRTGWILWSIVAFSASGAAYALRVSPLQRELLALADSAGDRTLAGTTYRSKSLRWELWGLFAVVTPILAFVLMVLKRPA